ncbi:transporter [Rubritalea spongiae]|uniref:Transporter n=1 Tax=Rubritalea spongiae TaxID=430797 RepID=A0ABW5E4E4_9BACT
MKNVVTYMLLGSTVSAFAGNEPLVVVDEFAGLRDLAADRPDATESPITVDKGHWQIETSAVDYTKDFDFQSWTWAETNLKYGVTDSMDIQFVFAPYIEENNDGVIEDGASDLTIRVKYNLWGNDGGQSALALFPYVKAPIGGSLSNDEWEGGFILPYAYEINEKWGFGCQLEWEYVYNEDKDGYDSNLLHTAVLGYALTDAWGMYVEYLGITGSEYQAHASGGLTYGVTEFFQLDLGAVVGLNDAATDLNAFTGFTVKF